MVMLLAILSDDKSQLQQVSLTGPPGQSSHGTLILEARQLLGRGQHHWHPIMKSIPTHNPIVISLEQTQCALMIHK